MADAIDIPNAKAECAAIGAGLSLREALDMIAWANRAHAVLR